MSFQTGENSEKSGKFSIESFQLVSKHCHNFVQWIFPTPATFSPARKKMPPIYSLPFAKALAVRLPVPLASHLNLPAKICCSQSLTMENAGSNTSRGALIVVEGLDRSGKTSQSSRLITSLSERGLPVESWRFPDRTTAVGSMISSYLANESHLDDRTIHLLFSANRWEKRSLMENKLKSGTTLIVDRYSYSGVAFSAAKGLGLEWCKAPEMGLLAPDLVVYLDILPEKAAERGGYGGERYEQVEFQRKVAQQYQALQDATWKVIDACLPLEDVAKQLRELSLHCISTCQMGKPLSYLWLNN